MNAEDQDFAEMDNATAVSGIITNYSVELWLFDAELGSDVDQVINVSKDGGSTWCSGHTIQMDANDCNASQASVTFNCSHPEAPLLIDEAKNNDIQIRYEPGDGIAEVNFVEHTWTYTASPTTKYGTTATATEVSRGAGDVAWVNANEDEAEGIDDGTEANSEVFNFGMGDESTHYLKVDMDNPGISGLSPVFSLSVQGAVKARYGTGIDDSTVFFQLSPDNGSTWCSSHHIGVLSSSLVWKNATCTHHTWTKTNVDNIEMRAYMTAEGALSGRVFIDAFRIIVSFADNLTTQLSLPTNLRVLLTSQIFLPSQLKVIATVQIFKPTSLKVRVLGQQVFLPSSIKVRVENNQIFLPSQLKVLLVVQLFLPTSLKVRVEENQIFLPSSLTVLLTSQIFLPSQLRVLLVTQIFLPTDLKVRVEGNQIFLPTSLRVSILSVTEFTPECTFNSYTLNASSGVHIDVNIDGGAYEGIKSVIGFKSDPYEATYTDDDVHELIYDVDSKSGTANFYHFPLVNGLTGSHEKITGMSQITWNDVWTTISGTIDISGDHATSGAKIVISVPNTGSSWTNPTPTGSNVYDVPAVYNGTLVVVNSPADWDGNLDHKIHDWCPYQLNVGHAVEVSDMDLISGSHVDNLIEVVGIINTDYLLDFKVYHASPSKWEWFSGATLIDSGTTTGHVQGTWDFIDNLAIGQQGGAGTYNHTLKLYSASGTFLYPSDPIRTMDLQFIIL